MQEIERAVDSGPGSTVLYRGSLVMYPIYKFGSEETRRNIYQTCIKAVVLDVFGV